MKIFISILFVVLLVWASISAAEKIRVSVTNYNMSYLAAGVAAERGFFKEEGLDVEIIRMNANVAMSSLISGGRRLHDDLRFGHPRRHARHSAQGHRSPDRQPALRIHRPP